MGNNLFGLLDIILRCLTGRKITDDFSAQIRSDVEDKIMPFCVQYFRKRQIIPEGRLWSRLHRYAEACPSGLAAIDCNDKDSVPPGCIRRINISTFQKDIVLNGNSMQITGAYANESILW